MPLLCNSFISDIFYLVSDTEICNYADDTTLYVGDKTLLTILIKLGKDTLIIKVVLKQFHKIKARQISSLNTRSKRPGSDIKCLRHKSIRICISKVTGHSKRHKVEF